MKVNVIKFRKGDQLISLNFDTKSMDSEDFSWWNPKDKKSVGFYFETEEGIISVFNYKDEILLSIDCKYYSPIMNLTIDVDYRRTESNLKIKMNESEWKIFHYKPFVCDPFEDEIEDIDFGTWILSIINNSEKFERFKKANTNNA